jgi:integrase
MARRPRAARLETRTARLKLAIRKKPYDFTSIAPGIALGYRRCASAGRWVVKVATGGGNAWTKVVGIADDHEDADGESILNFHEATDKARVMARGGRGGRPETLAEAIQSYQRDLVARGGDVSNAQRVRYHLTPTLLAKPVGLLTTLDLKRWRDAQIADGMKPATVQRTIKALRAACNLAAKHDRRITNRDAWRDGLSGLADTFNTRNATAILTDEQVAALVAAAYAVDPALGLYCECAAVCGSRPSQIAKLNVADLQDARPDPRVMMWTSRKGRNRKVTQRPVPITPNLGAKLRKAAGKRAPTAPLLLRADGQRWKPEITDHLRLFAEAASRAGMSGATMYNLRHSAVVRMLLAGVPLRIVAAQVDSSAAILEKVYSPFILDHADTIARRGLLDLSQPAAGNVVPLARKG